MNNLDWQRRSRESVWHPCTQMKHLEGLPPLPIARGEGPWLVDTDGKRYLDAISSWWVNLFGHANPRINQAIVDQLGRIEHVILAGCTHAPVVELSERLAGLTGLSHAFYGSDGASAVEIALKMSFHYWRNRDRPYKTNFVSLQNGYHGETLGALSVTDVPLFKDTYAPLLRQTHQWPSPDWRLAEPGESPEAYARRCADQAETYLAECADSTAAIIVEPLVQGAAGMAMYHPVYLTRLRQLCDAYEVHLIADEIAVGFGRTGTLFACEQAPSPASIGEEGNPRGEPGDKPGKVSDIADFLCLSKGITGGYLPLSCVLTTDAVHQAFYDDSSARGFLHSHSYTGNPLACRASLAVLDIFDEEAVLAANREKAARFSEFLAPLANHSRVRHFRHTGMIWAFDLDHAPPHFSREFHRQALSRGLFIRPLGNTVYFMPPYVIDEAEMGLMASVAMELVEAL